MVAPNEEHLNSHESQGGNEKSINIELSEEIAAGSYSNLVLVSHSPTEFVIDFAKLLPGPAKGKVHTRIIMTPQHVKSLIHTLQENLGRYEKSFGTVQPPSNDPRSNGNFEF
jgi:hypothetical protein